MAFPAHAGARRGGPDLAWFGDRYATQEAVAERLAVHAAGGAAVDLPWLFSPEAGQDRDALAAYLLGLRSGPASP